MIAVVYYSKKGSTEKMAEAVLAGAKEISSDCVLVKAADIDSLDMSKVKAFALGCPADQQEGLEAKVFEPALEKVEKELLANSSKNFVLFGSYGWGGGKYMENWLERCSKKGLSPLGKQIVCKGEPDDFVLEDCAELGRLLAKS